MFFYTQIQTKEVSNCPEIRSLARQTTCIACCVAIVFRPTRVAALLHTGNLMCAIHWVSPNIGCVALTDELTAFQNHTAAISTKQRTMIFSASSYEEIIAELDRRMDLLREHQYDQIQITGNEYSELNQALSKVIGAPLLEELGDIKDFVQSL